VGLPLLAPHFAGLYLAMGLIGLAVFRLAKAGSRSPQLSWRQAPVLACAAVGIVMLWTIAFQYLRMSQLLFGYNDVGIYYKRIANWFAHGAFHQVDSDHLPFQFHFGPALALLAPVLAMWPSVGALIVAQSVGIVGTGLLLFGIVKWRGGSPGAALAICLCYLLHPATTQQTYCYGFGFHPTTLALPCVVMAWYWMDEGHYWRGGIAALLALGWQEHVAVYFIGMGSIWLLLRERRRLGIAGIAIGTAYFLLATRVFIPESPAGDIEAMKLWGQFGGSMRDVILAPFTKPAIFFSYLFNGNNFHYSLQLLLPMGLLCLARPRFLLALWPIFLFNFLRHDWASRSIAFQYHTLSLGVLFLAAAMGAARRGPWLAAALVVAIFANVFLGLTPWTRGNLSQLGAPVPGNVAFQAYLELNSMIPRDATVTGDERTMTLFLNHRLVRDYRSSTVETDYHVYQIGYRASPPGDTHARVRELLATGDYHVHWEGHGCIVLKRQTPLPPLAEDVF
jgi:uncharacterized membrane protein